MISLEVSVGKLKDGLDELRDKLDGQGLAAMNSSVALHAGDMTRRYLTQIGAQRHSTANRLGARPTGVIEKAKVTHDSDSSGASVSIEGAVFSRTFKDVRIVPKTARFLTLPIAAESYGKRVGELEREGFSFFVPKGSRALWGKQGESEAKPLYILARSVVQSQDRSLLPSDREFALSGLDGVENFLRRYL